MGTLGGISLLGSCRGEDVELAELGCPLGEQDCIAKANDGPRLCPQLYNAAMSHLLSLVTEVEGHVEEIRKHLDRLLQDAAECQRISDLSTDPFKRDLFAKLADHHRVLAAELERAIVMPGSQ